MKKNLVRNLILKTLAYSFIISALPYSYFLWHAKQGIDAYLVTRDFDAKLDYSWLWINHDGEIYLEDVRIFKTRRSPIIRAPRVKISLPSIFDLLDSREQVVYKTYPSQIRLSVIGAYTKQPETALNLFGIKYKKEYAHLFFPQECTVDGNTDLPDLVFDLSSTFKIQQTADIAQVNFKFKDAQLATIKGSFNINRLLETGVNTAYLSDLKINLEDLTWIEQNTLTCQEKIKLSRNKLTIFYRDLLNQKALDKNLTLDKVATQEFSDFFYKPESIDIQFDIEEGTTYSQIDFYPIVNFQKRVGLSIHLNKRSVGMIFNGHTTNIEELIVNENGDTTLTPADNLTTKNKKVFISKSKQSLTKYLGSKIKLNLYSGRPHIGYLESISRDQILLKKLEYRGKSTLPFEYSQIKSIQLLVAEN